MRIYCADDSLSHLDRIERTVHQAMADVDGLVVERFEDGEQLLDRFRERAAEVVALDINMPKLDGLSALVRIKELSPACEVIMVSAENKVATRRLAENQRFDEPEDVRIKMLDRVVDRVRTGTVESGKINSVLEACASLGLDPVDVARRNGAAGFLHKPFEPDEAASKLRHLILSSLTQGASEPE